MIAARMVVDAPEDVSCSKTEQWGYGGYGQFHMVVWIILAIAAVVGIAWRLLAGL
jgi:hypothetical protein